MDELERAKGIATRRGLCLTTTINVAVRMVVSLSRTLALLCALCLRIHDYNTSDTKVAISTIDGTIQ